MEFVMAQSDNNFGEALARLERDMANMKNAIALLGARPCCVCAKFYLSSSAGNLFAACGETVCYGCLSGWWPGRCQSLSIPDRESSESKLMRWLTEYHQAKVFHALAELPPRELEDVHIVIGCYECKGTGILGRERCRHCHGNGTAWLVTMK
jgi:hypothetical protein